MDGVNPIPVNFGQPDPAHVVGRERELSEIRSHLVAGSSVLLTGERRIGKSWVLRALQASPPKDWIPVYADCERVSDVEHLLRIVTDRVVEQLPLPDRALEWLRDSGLDKVGGVPLPLAKHEPYEDLQRLVRIVGSQGHRLLLLLDELPILAQELAKRGDDQALRLLRTLRALRLEESSALRQVLAGSIGFHHVLAGSAEIMASVNDLFAVPVGRLDTEGAVLLARRLLAGIGVDTRPNDPVAAATAEAADGIPFYEHLLVAGLAERSRAGLPLDVDAVWSTRTAALEAGHDPWKIRHYIERIKEYFGPDERLALALLDVIALAGDDGVTFDGLLDRVGVDEAVALLYGATEPEAVRAILARLRLDHYVDRDGPRFRFCFSVVRQGWVEQRYLPPAREGPGT